MADRSILSRPSHLRHPISTNILCHRQEQAEAAGKQPRASYFEHERTRLHNPQPRAIDSASRNETVPGPASSSITAMSTNDTRPKRHPAGLPLRKAAIAIRSPTAVHEFVDDASDVTETSSDCSSLEEYLSIHDATEVPAENGREVEDEDEAYRGYFARMARRLAERSAAENARETTEEDARDPEVPAVDVDDEAAPDASPRRRRPSGDCCGMTDGAHDALLHSADWLCRTLLARRPVGREEEEEASAAIAIQSKWRSFIAAKHYAATLSSVLVFVRRLPSEGSLNSCAAAIQSRWRTHAASRRYARIIAAVAVIQSFLRRELAQQCIGDISIVLPERPEDAAAIRCQSAVRRWIAARRAKERREAAAAAAARCYPNRKRVARTGQIELILDGASGAPDETFTAYSETSDTSWEEEDDEEGEGDEEEEEEDETSCCPSVEENSEVQYEHSRCGLSDNVHEMLIQSGKWIYDRVGDPGIDTAHDLLTIMEISEDVVFCCGGRPSR